MPNAPLSDETRLRLDALFPEHQRAEAAELLTEQCGNNLPFLEKLDAQQLDRFRFAALKLSHGDLAALKEAVEQAKVDWRDLLMAAGFGHDLRAHQAWFPGGHAA